MVGQRISFSDNLQKLKLWTLCIAMETDDSTSTLKIKPNNRVASRQFVHIIKHPSL